MDGVSPGTAGHAAGHGPDSRAPSGQGRHGALHGQGEYPRTAFGDPDAYAVHAATQLVPADRAARARRHDAVVDALDSVVKRAGDVTGL